MLAFHNQTSFGDLVQYPSVFETSLFWEEKTVAYLMELQKKKDAAFARKARWRGQWIPENLPGRRFVS